MTRDLPPTRDQRLAVTIYERVRAIQTKYGENEASLNRYGSMAHRLPILIRTAGLAQALAFVDARGKTEHRDLLNDLAQVVFPDDPQADATTLVEKSRKTANLREYLFLTQITLDALLWFKRFAQSVLNVTADMQGEGDDH